MSSEQKLFLTSPIPPSVNHYLAHRAIMKNGKPLSVSYCTEISKKYKSEFTNYVIEQCLAQEWVTLENPLQHYYVDGYFYFGQTDMDCNNYWKVLLDAITDSKLIWPDDNVVCERVQRILYDSINPRIDLVIYPVDYIGVFDNQSCLDSFESRCQDCSRYSRNCSILRLGKEGRVQSEVVDGSCTKYSRKKEKKGVKGRGKKD